MFKMKISHYTKNQKDLKWKIQNWKKKKKLIDDNTKVRDI